MSEEVKKFQVLGKFTPELVPSAQVGQTIVVKAVDETGKPIEWEAANFPEGNSPAIIDVIELPTENIQEGVFYRKLTIQYSGDGEVWPYANGTKIHCVGSLPETGEVVTNAEMAYVVGYYSVADTNVYGYVDEAVGSAFGVPAGWYPFDALAQLGGVSWGGVITSPSESYDRDGLCAILVREIYIYDVDHWVKIPTAYEYPPYVDISWDGEIGDRFSMDMEPLGYDPGTYLVKMSDDVLDQYHLVGSVQTLSNYEVLEVYDYYDIDTSIPGVYTVSSVGIVYDAATTNSALGLPDGTITDGIYFTRNDSLYIKNFKTRPSMVPMDAKSIDYKLPSLLELWRDNNIPTRGDLYKEINNAIGSAIGGSY